MSRLMCNIAPYHLLLWWKKKKLKYALSRVKTSAGDRAEHTEAGDERLQSLPPNKLSQQLLCSFNLSFKTPKLRTWKSLLIQRSFKEQEDPFFSQFFFFYIISPWLGRQIMNIHHFETNIDAGIMEFKHRAAAIKEN